VCLVWEMRNELDCAPARPAVIIHICFEGVSGIRRLGSMVWYVFLVRIEVCVSSVGVGVEEHVMVMSHW